IGIMDRLIGLQVFSESDFELNQLAELGIDYIYQASNAISAEYFTYVSHELTKVNEKYNRYGIIQDVVLIICLPLALIGIALLFRSLIRGLTVINAGTERISRKDWNTPDIPPTRISELNQVIEATNLMKKTIVDYIGALEEHMRVSELLAERTLESERQKRIIQETQFHLLQAQINPHFLFNTLNLIVNNVRAGVRLKETADVLVSTSKLLRSSIELKSKVIPLRDELRLLDNYITIQKVRNEDRIVFCVIVMGDIPEVEIPPFTLQPLVENSILHGLKDITVDGYVEIQIFSDEANGAMIQIHDNGTGIPEEIEKAAVAGTLSSNGLGNVVNRLKMIYSNDDIIRFSKAGNGSTTIIHLDVNKRRTGEC
ncbi:MAG: histidine kinase, partial [Spirochaetales bacterium]|nr:histidine kinase [Spirochaetales bacterium]